MVHAITLAHTVPDGVTPLARIRDVFGSNLGQDTYYVEDLHGFPQIFQTVRIVK
jgi:hypothetical protein